MFYIVRRFLINGFSWIILNIWTVLSFILGPLVSIASFLVWGCAVVGLGADCICWWIGKQTFGEFAGWLIPICLGFLVPFLLRGMVHLIDKAETKVKNALDNYNSRESERIIAYYNNKGKSYPGYKKATKEKSINEVKTQKRYSP